jgi:DNA-binding transcriptional ArsR family regulator
MSDGSPLPFRPAVGDQEPAPRVVDLDEEAADRVIDALSAETARKIYRALRDEPRTPPELAERVDCSLQTVHYHLGSLEEASLVESAGTGYSEKGVEMTVYRPADRPLVLTTAEAETGLRLRQFLGRILGVLGGLAVVSLLVQWVAPDAGGGQSGGVNATAPIGDPGVGGSIPPGLLVFAGGLVALLLVAGLSYWTAGR